MLRKLLSNIHWLLGITVGIGLAVIGLTGAILAFEDELINVINGRPQHVAAAGRTPLSPAALQAAILQAHPGQHIAALTLYSDSEHAAEVKFAGNMAMSQNALLRNGDLVDPFTGKLINVPSQPRGQSVLFIVGQLHSWLMLGGPPTVPAGAPMMAPPTGPTGFAPPTDGAMGMPPGMPMPGMSPPPGMPGMGDVPANIANRDLFQNLVVLALLIMIPTGFYLRWPRRNRLDWRTWFRVNFSLKGFAFNWNLHMVLGTIVLFGYLFSVHSGLMMSSFKWYSQPISRAANAKVEFGPELGVNAMMTGMKPANTITYDLDTLWDRFRGEVPAFYSATLKFSDSNADEFHIDYLDNAWVHPDGGRDVSSLVLHVADASVKQHQRFSDRPLLQRLVIRNFDLHSGHYFGLVGRLFMAFCSLMMPVLLITGYLMYLSRRKQKKQRNRQAAARAATT